MYRKYRWGFLTKFWENMLPNLRLFSNFGTSDHNLEVLNGLTQVTNVHMYILISQWWVHMTWWPWPLTSGWQLPVKLPTSWSSTSKCPIWPIDTSWHLKFYWHPLVTLDLWLPGHRSSTGRSSELLEVLYYIWSSTVRSSELLEVLYEVLLAEVPNFQKFYILYEVLYQVLLTEVPNFQNFYF